jgi:hypothetical protein
MFKIMVMSDIMNIMNGPDTGAILTQNVIPVISVQPILYQLPYGATKKEIGPAFS